MNSARFHRHPTTRIRVVSEPQAINPAHLVAFGIMTLGLGSIVASSACDYCPLLLPDSRVGLCKIVLENVRKRPSVQPSRGGSRRRWQATNIRLCFHVGKLPRNTVGRVLDLRTRKPDLEDRRQGIKS
jgi:hypothetical protein